MFYLKKINFERNMNFLSNADWSFPIPIYYGPDRIKELPNLCKLNNLSRPLIVTDRGSATLPFINNLLKDLNNSHIKCNLFSEISPNPLDKEINNGKFAFKNGRHDSIIAIGGGSGMDGGKAISLIANNSHELWEFDYDKTPISELSDFPPLICVPTTAGTGAETESTAMITNSELGMKLCIWHPKQKPIAAILDPKLTLGLPKTLTAWTGVDALVHGLEAYSVNSLYAVADGMALEGLNLIGNHLSEVYQNPDNISSRGGMLIGSCLTGISFLKGLGLVHAISHMVGAVYNTQHGLTNAILLPKILQFNKNAISQKIKFMHFALYKKPGTFNDLYSNICNLLDELEIPDGLGKIGVKNDKINELAIKSSKDAAALTNPRVASINELESIIKDSVFKTR